MEIAGLDAAAIQLAGLLLHGGGELAAPGNRDLVFDGDLVPRPLSAGAAPADVWAVDGGQGLVCDARCLQVLVTRAARVRLVNRRCVLEDEGPLVAHLLGAGATRAAVDGLGLGVAPDAGLDGVIDLLRDAGEWKAVRQCIDEAAAGALILVDGDLVPDWRIPSAFVGELLTDAADRGITLVGVTKHSSLSRGGAPLLGQLELEAAATLGAEARWWAPIARTRHDLGGGLQIVAVRLDPSARFAFRVDLPAGVDPEPILASLCAVSDDAAFPGYPYPLTVADRLAACPGWVRDEVRLLLDEQFDRLAVPMEVRERAFADRHRLMERA